MRQELLHYLKILADRPHQERSWNSQAKHGENHELDCIIHFIYDDTWLSRDAKKTIGWFLLSNEEANGVFLLIQKLDYIFEKYGIDTDAHEFIQKSEWLDVVDAASMVYSILVKTPITHLTSSN